MKSYIQLLLTSIKAKNLTSDRKSVVLVFTSSEPGEGVSYVVNSFAVELAQRTSQRILVADADGLQEADIFHRNQIPKYCRQVDFPNLFLLQAGEDEFGFAPKKQNGLQLRRNGTKLERGLNNVRILRCVFDFVLIDASSLSDSGDAALLAPSADGTVLIVEADRTRREQVANSIKTIEMANGNFLGCVMNKRSYPVPNWIYQRI